MSNFIMPPNIYNQENKLRKAGFELEFSNIDMEKILDILQSHFEFQVQKHNNFLYTLSSKDGDFTLELDFELLTKQTLKSNIKQFFEEFGVNIKTQDLENLEQMVGKLSKDIVPYEISTPPLPLNKLDLVDKIVSTLSQNNAKGTKDKLYNAFGLHINIELVSLEVSSILNYLKAYLILQDYINKDAQIDLARKITPYIDNFKPEYIKYVLDENHFPTQDQLIDDYLFYNPTRNRSLDMLPILAFLDEKRVREKLPKEKIKPRPAFHYRLSNSMIGDPNWEIADEWNRWILVENLANDKKGLEQLSKEYLQHIDNFINLQTWESKVKQWLLENM